MILDGKEISNKILLELKEQIENNNLKIKLAVILVGDDEASKIYVRNKKNACEKIGITFEQFDLPRDTSQDEVVNLINKLNQDPTVTGIILQSPVPNGIDYDCCSSKIDCRKDVDGFTKENVYKLYLNGKSILPCTVKGIIRLLKEYQIDLDGANIVIVGRGNIVGKPLALALINENATVTLAHSHTKNLSDITKNADIIIAAAGVPNLITVDMIKENSVVIDVGVSRIDGKIRGDIDFENIRKKAAYVTPNPGGVGPMTVAMIMDNLVEMSEVNNG